MPVFNNILAGAAGQTTGGAAAAGPIKSVRFNPGDNAHLDRTPSSAGNQRTFTIAFWAKLCDISSSTNYFYTAGSGSPGGLNSLEIGIDLYNRLFISEYGATLSDYFIEKTSAYHRDPSAWYHFIIAVDTTQSTATNRVKFYVNGVEQDKESTSYPFTQNRDTAVNGTSKQTIGSDGASDLSGYLADFYLIDGSQKEATDFGAFDDNGVWQAAGYSGSFGTNGFHLFDFANESTVGHDSSVNGNDFTANNISTTAGADNDVLFDVPVNGSTDDDTGAGGEVSGNYATLNPLSLGNATLSNGNLDCNVASSGGKWGAASTIGVTSGKFYIEVKCVNAVHGNTQIGVGDSEHIIKSQVTENVGTAGQAVYYRSFNGKSRVYTNGSSADSTYGDTYTQNDIIGIALNADDQEVTFYKNGTAQNSGTAISIPTTSQAIFLSLCEGGSDGPDFECNFGQRAYTYSAPSGYKALCTSNIPTPTIADGSDYFDTKLYDGTGSAQTISGLSFSPDLVWLKRRSSTESNTLFDTVRGAGKEIISDSTSTEYDAGTGSSGSLIAFNSDGFDLGTRSSVNGSSTTNVAWAWDAGSSTVSNTDGSITTSVRANQTAGFSIVSYDGNATAGATVGHGLNAEPSLVIVKTRETAAANNWTIYHKSVGNTHGAYFDTAAFSDDAGYWDDTSPSSSVVTLGNYDVVNASSKALIMYAFAPVAGYSAFGSYVGNVSTDGPFVYTGFRPKFLLVKGSDIAVSWQIYDAERNTFNLVDDELYPDRSDAENNQGVSGGFDFLSNGFKVRSSDSWLNSNSNDYIYAAFAEHPLSLNGGLAR